MIGKYIVNNQDRYTIDYRAQPDGSIKLFAIEHPPDPHGRPVQENHLYASGEICVAAGNEPKTMDRAKAIAVHFMEGYSTYVRTGIYPKGGRRVHV